MRKPNHSKAAGGASPHGLDSRHPLRPRHDHARQLRTFCQAARLGSFSHAAEYLGSSQSAVSQHVRALEEEYAASLFERRGTHVSLTRVGKRLYRLAMPLVARMDRLPGIFFEQHHGVATDSLRIGAGQTSATYLLPEYLRRFRAQYPEIPLEIRTGTGADRLRWLRGYELDIVVTAMTTPPEDLAFHPFRNVSSILITPLDHPLAGREFVEIEEVSAWPMVGHPREKYIRQAAEMFLRLRGIVPNVVAEVDGWDDITCYVEAGIGISYAPDICVNDETRVWRIPIDDYLPPRRYGVVTRRDEFLSLAARRFFRIMIPADRDSGA